MTHPLTPREKDVQQRVEKIVFEKFYGGPLSGSRERLAAALIAEFNLTALASGSGDHAELARLAEAGGLMIELADAPQPKDTGGRFFRAMSSINAYVARLNASKEAERGGE